MSMSRSDQQTVAICVSAILIGGLLWKSAEDSIARKMIGRSLVYFGVNRILPVLLD